MPFSLSPRLWRVRRFAVTLLASLGTALFGQPNTPSAVDGFDPNANGLVSVALTQGDGKIVLGGAFTTLRPNGALDNVDRNYLARVNADGTLDAVFNPNANGQVFALAAQSTGKIIVGGTFTTIGGVARSRIARLNTDGTVDTTFNIDLGGGLAPEVYALVVLPDDRIVVGGAFTAVGSVTRNRIARFSSNGALDLTFDPNANAPVLSLARQNDGKVILGGSFTALQPAGASDPTARRFLARLNINGTPDSQFDPKPDNSVRAIAVQADGGIVIGGNFSNVQPLGNDSPVLRSRIARLNPDGTLDGFYNPNANGQVSTFVLQPDGRLLLAGNFTVFVPNGGAAVNRSFVARLNVDGTVDPAFQVLPNAAIQGLALQSDGRVVVGGTFTQLRATGSSVAVNRNHVARLNADGTPDTTLDPAATGLVLVQATQSDGKTVVGGSFIIMGGLTRYYIARLNTDGTVDTAFNPSINAPVLAIAIDANQNILIGGAFTNIGGVARNYLARLLPTGALDTSFDPSPNNQINAIAVQSDSKIVVSGAFTALSPAGGAFAIRNHFARLTSAGTLDTAFDPNADAGAAMITIQPTDQKLLLCGSFTSFAPNAGTAVSRPYAARLNTDGTVDTSYYPLPNAAVESQAIQADGKIILGGNFTAFAPKAAGTVVTRFFIARFNTDSTIDTSFNPRAGSTVAALAVQTDGKILAGGLFSFFRPGDDVTKNIDRNRLARINADGTIDTSYDPNVGGQVSTLTLLSSGKLMVGGGFTSMKPPAQGLVLVPNRIARLNTDGTVDTAFDPAVTTRNGGSVETLAVQPDAKLIVAGAFSNFGGSRSSNLERFTASGDADTSFIPNPDGPVSAVLVQPARTSVPQANVFAWFNANSTLRTTFNSSAVAQLGGQINTILVQANGQMILGGNFTNRAGTNANYLVRLNPNGAIDPTFDPEPGSTVNAIVQLPDGRFIIGGAFDAVGGVTRHHLARLNADGSLDTSYDPWPGDTVYALALQTDGKLLVAGAFTTFQPNGATATTARSFLARLNADGTLDTAYNPTPSALVRALALQPDGNLIAGGDFVSFQPNGATTTTTRNFIARLKNTGDLDTDFNPTANATVYAITLQADLKPIIGGSFTVLQPTNGGPFVRNYIARLNTDGSVDSNFNPSPNNFVRAVAVTPDGSVVLGGSFTSLQPGSSFYPIARNHVAIVGSDGALNYAFNPGPSGDVLAVAALADGSVLAGGAFTSLAADASLIVGGSFAYIGGAPVANIALLDSDGSVVPTFAPAPDGAVTALAQQPDTKLIIGGVFTHVGGLPRSHLARIGTDGAVDTTFAPNVSDTVNALALQLDGKILIGGAFTSVAGTARLNLARLNSDGSLETGFAPAANGQVSAILVRPDGKIVVAGSFTTLAGQTRNRLALLNSDGSLDPAFNPNVNGPVASLVASTDGKITLGGTFTSVSGAGRNNVARLNADGSLDSSFDPNADGSVLTLALLPDGAPVLGGTFSAVTGQPRFRLARLAVGNSVTAQTVSASSDRTTLTWTRTGAGPELSSARFEFSTDAITWTPLTGTVSRVITPTSSNWRITGQSLPVDSTFYVRALGNAPTSKNASSGLIRSEQIFNFGQTPVFSSGATVGASTDKSFRYATSDGKVAAYSATGLPSGLAIDAATGVISGTATQTGNFVVTLMAANASGNVSATLNLNVNNGTGAVSGLSIRLINLSARTQVSGTGTAITGFASNGGKVLVRAIGPGLTAFGVGGALADPVLRVYDSAGVKIVENNDWSGSDIVAANAATGAFPLVASSKDAALVLDLAPGGYTAQVTDGAGRGGVVLTEIYDANGATTTPRFSNLSARAPVAPGSPLVGGFVISAASGTSTQKVLIRGVGPGIAKFGVANTLADPVLKVYDAAGNLIATSDNWSTDANANAGSIAAAATATGAFALDAGSKDAALLLTLAPGGYTLEITAAPGSAGSGEALADIYAAP